MYQLAVPLNVYQRIKQNLFEIHPEIKVALVSCDYALASLGFVGQPPCVIHVDLTQEGMEQLLDELMDYEIDSVDMPKQSKEYQAYVKYGGLWDIFYSAERIDP
ncbi:MAG: hypothetical protein IK116_01960 [Firmicutes bacterium]|nr:hypothetical protein [Bacillota bacterium]